MAFQQRAACAATPKTSRLRRGVSAPASYALLEERHAINPHTGGHDMTRKETAEPDAGETVASSDAAKPKTYGVNHLMVIWNMP